MFTTIQLVDEANEPTPDIDALVAELRSRVEARRQAGVYPAGLEEEMSAHFQRILHQRRERRPLPDVAGPVQAAGAALPLQAAKIPVDSALPGGQALHKTVARVVGRQIQGTLQQVQGFAQPVHAALEALTAAVEELNRLLSIDVAQSLDALYERQAAQERILAAAGFNDRRIRNVDFHTLSSSERFDEAFRDSREEMLDRYRELAERLVGCDPVLDVGFGRGEFLELLAGRGVEARAVEKEDALRYLRAVDDKALGGLSLIQVIEHFSASEIVDLVALAADKVRPGGRVFLETINPQSLVHPAYLAFLFREAGFASVDIQDYLIVASR